VGCTDFVSPITSSNRNNADFAKDNCATNGSGNFFGTFNAQADVTVHVSNDHKRLETCSLAGTGLLLDRHDLHDFIFQLGAQKPIDNLVFFDWERK